MECDFGALGTPGRYKLLVGLVTPRPIAFVSTRGRDGVDNAAPFSFFNVLADDPPVVIVSIERRHDGRSKDSGRNILEACEFVVENIKMAYVFYESGLSINVLYTLEDSGKRAVGFKLSDGMDVPEELSSFKFARQKSKLAGTIRGSYFVIKNEH